MIPENKRAEQSEKTKQKLLTASLKLFVHKGYSGTTVRDIAKTAGVSPGLTFHYFPSKQAMLEEHIKTLNKGVASVERVLDSEQPLAAFTTLAATMLDSFKDQQDATKYFFLLSHHIMASDSIPLQTKQLLNDAGSLDTSIPLILLGQQQGVIRPGDPHMLALVFWGVLQGVAQLLVWRPDMPIPDPGDIVAVLTCQYP